MSRTEVCAATSDADYALARALVREYADALDVDLCFENRTRELETLQTIYGPPCGFLVLARQRGANVGCVAVRELTADTCEMKRLYVRPRVRGSGVGRALVLDAIHRARLAGYRRMVLDTLTDMVAARRLYHTLGFRECPPYYQSPLPDPVYMELELQDSPAE